MCSRVSDVLWETGPGVQRLSTLGFFLTHITVYLGTTASPFHFYSCSSA